MSVRFDLRKHQELGFSLIELMTVMSIIGALLVFATASFDRFAARARQTEAKVLIANAHTGLATHRFEHGTYTACLNQVGGFPEDAQVIDGVSRSSGFYGIGFDLFAPILFNCGPLANQSCLTYHEVSTCTLSEDTLLLPLKNEGFSIEAAIMAGVFGAWGYLGSSSYILYSAGHIRLGATFDIWAIDQDKKIYNAGGGI